MNEWTLSLDGSWRLSGRREGRAGAAAPRFDEAEFTVDAVVPGNIEDDLLRAGRVEDPYFGENARQLRPYEFYEWLYEREFDYDGAPRELDLRLDGLDCFGSVWINGVFLGSTENALVGHVLAVPANALVAGVNRIAVHIAGANRRLARHPLAGDAFSAYPLNYEATRVRKPAHAWGWDITPRAALGGLFRPVELRERAPDRIVDGFLQTLFASPEKARLRYGYHVDTRHLGDPGLRLTVDGVSGDSNFHAESPVWAAHGVVGVDLPCPRLWWPRNYGTPALYDVTVRLLAGGALLDERRFAAGVRTVELRRRPTVTNRPDPDFQFVVNGLPIRVFGCNHVPMDALHGREAGRVDTVMDLAVDSGCAMLRVWGGGIYEHDAFYERCDREGILVWQDFMMACAIYPNDPEFLEVMRDEAEKTVTRLRQHPSIALWAGDNECDEVPGWARLRTDPNANRITREVLPDVCRRLDPTRPYLPSSPFYSPEAVAAAEAAGGGDPAMYSPEQHLWGPRDYFKSDFYRGTRASFLSETGYHGCPNVSGLRRFLPESSLWPCKGDANWYYHASNPFRPDNTDQDYRIDIMCRQVREFFGFEADNVGDFARASQICQMEALKFLIERFRADPKRSGMLWWNLIDCWPQSSDSVVDYYGGRKLAYPIIRRLQRPLLLMISEASHWKRRVLAANDSSRGAEGSYRVRDAETGEEVLSGEFRAPAGKVSEIASFEAFASDRRLWLIDWTLSDRTRGCNHLLGGFPAYDYAHFTRSWLPALAAQDGSFDPARVAE